MTGGTAARTRAPALWTLLLGLLLMHGSPAAAAAGCHDTAYSPDPAAAAGTGTLATAMAGHTARPAAVPPAPDATPMAGSAIPAAGTPVTLTGPRHTAARTAPAQEAELRAAGTVHSGGTCTATPVRERVAPAAAHTVVTVSAHAPAAVPGAAAGPERRGPPGSGRELLLKVSVARR
ncbi:hypothetical protein [Streptomyces sp. NPDC020917]|uniref:hypothetical protein n=1 Tax=Streptomyces sp. NPDC020917 TaxID=3365102 RepID=UPI00378F58EA